MSHSHILDSLLKQVSQISTLKITGHVTAIKGLIVECNGITPLVSIGSMCKVFSNTGSIVISEVVGFSNEYVLLMAFSDLTGVGPGAKVEVSSMANYIYPDVTWKGRVINAFGTPIDGTSPIKHGNIPYFLKNQAPNSQKRNLINTKIELGVRSIDTFATCCYGQRMGIFAGSGVGKSILISMLTRHAKADVKVIGLIGERGREVREFVQEYLGEEGLKNAIIVVATGDESALNRKRAAYTTLTIAEYFRDMGNEVLCIIDSVTRFAMAMREIGLAVGEPPTTKGYTPSVFSELPKLLERAGPGTEDTNITGLFTVLVDGDDHNEPISDAVRGILDGHIVLDRKIAERGRYPAIDILRSVSRTIPKCNTTYENRLIQRAKKMISLYSDMEDMIRIGAYKTGTSFDVDEAIRLFANLESFLNQDPSEHSSMEESYIQLAKILNMEQS